MHAAFMVRVQWFRRIFTSRKLVPSKKFFLSQGAGHMLGRKCITNFKYATSCGLLKPATTEKLRHRDFTVVAVPGHKA